MALTKKTVLTTIRHNSFLFGSITITIMSLLWIYGCESQVKSLKYPTLRVNRSELMLELQNIISEAELRISDLDRQDEFKQAMFDIVLVSAQGGTINPIGVAMTLGSLLGFAAVIDNRKKDAVIKTLQSKTA